VTVDIGAEDKVSLAFDGVAPPPPAKEEEETVA
jgi:hypothetical protein